jgi:hypothetical protein
MLLDMAFAENVSYLLIFIYLFYLFISMVFFPLRFVRGGGPGSQIQVDQEFKALKVGT